MLEYKGTSPPLADVVGGVVTAVLLLVLLPELSLQPVELLLTGGSIGKLSMVNAEKESYVIRMTVNTFSYIGICMYKDS